MLRISLVLSAVTLGLAVWADDAGRPWQSMAFFALGAAQLGVAIGSRSRPRTWANPLLLVAVAAALSLQVAGLYLPLLRDLLDTVPLSAAELAGVAALSALGYAAILADRPLRPGTADTAPQALDSAPSSGRHRI